MFVLGWSFGILSPKSLPLSSENKLVSHLWQSAEPLRPFLTKWWKESSSICSICSLRMLLGGKTTRTTRYICTICISFAIAQSWCIRLCSKLSAKLQHVSARDEQQLLSVHLWAKKLTISFNRILFLKDKRSQFGFITNHGTCQWASCKTTLDAINKTSPKRHKFTMVSKKKYETC